MPRPPTRIIELVGPTPKEWGDTSIAEPWVGVKFGHDLSIYHIPTFTDTSQMALYIPAVRAFALHTESCITAHPDHTISRWRSDPKGHWQHQLTLTLPEEYRAFQPVSRVHLSPSGRFLQVHMASHTLLYQVEDWRLLQSFTNPGATAQFSFFTMPSGRELAYLTTDSYMEVTLIDCETGERLYQSASSSLFDLIHTGMRISHDGRWLFASGLVWADKIEALIYDIQEWKDILEQRPAPGPTKQIAEAQAAAQRQLPWKRVLRFYPSFSCEDALLPAADAVQGGVCCIHSHTSDVEGHAEEVEDDDGMFNDVQDIEKDLVMALYALRHDYEEAYITRWIRLDDQTLLRFEVQGTKPRPGRTPALGEHTENTIPALYTPPPGRHTTYHRCPDGKTWVVRVWRDEVMEP